MIGDVIFWILLGLIFLVFIAGAIDWVHTAVKGKCPYCSSDDLIPDHAMYWYCNGCRRKF